MNSRLRSLAFGALLLVLPFSGIRVICIESPAVPSDPATVETKAGAEEPPLTDCQRLCPFHPPAGIRAADPDAAGATSEDEPDCTLSSDGSALQMLGTFAVLRPHAPLAIPDVVSDVIAAAPRFYAEPALAHLAPPPKQQAL